jgi:hypothetical protein
MWLNEQQLEELTGYTYAAHQVGWLTQKGFYHEVNGQGVVKVLVKHVEDKMNPKASTSGATPHWDKL